MFIFAQFIGILASTLNIGKYFVREEYPDGYQQNCQGILQGILETLVLL